ncbi:hypothetical protein Q8F55_005421 [Vanrija albida]|uniref:F-box domain-containing protein n=1 Tax=Vanrija albida TaxID=181172 RepID=A0ABR3Q1M3_9TREE
MHSPIVPLAPATSRSLVVLAEGQLPGLQWTQRANTQDVYSALRPVPGNGARTRYTATFTFAEIAELDAILAALSNSRLTSICFLYDPSPKDEVYARILARLNVPALRHLWIAARPSGETLPLALAFLSSPRAAGLQYFSIDFEAHSAKEAPPDMGLLAGCAAPPPQPRGAAAPVKPRRLVGVLEENGERRARVRDAVRRAIVPARVLLRGRRAEGPEAEPTSAVEQAPLPILDLPRELLHAIVEHASGDAGALTPAQWARLHRHAEDPGGLCQVAAGMVAAEADPAVGKDAGWDEWLHNGGFWWEERRV